MYKGTVTCHCVWCAQSETEERGLSAHQYLNPKKGLAMPHDITDGVSTIVATIDHWGILW